MLLLILFVIYSAYLVDAQINDPKEYRRQTITNRWRGRKIGRAIRRTIFDTFNI